MAVWKRYNPSLGRSQGTLPALIIGGLRPAGFSCRRKRGTQSGDQRQDFGEQPAGHRDLGELERDVSAVADDLRADLDQLLAGWSETTAPPSLASPACA